MSHARLRLHDSVVRFVTLDRFFIGESERREQAKDNERCGKRLIEQAMLLGEWWHGRPMVVDVRDVVCAQDVQVARSQNRGIADFCCVLWPWWQCAEKSIQRVKKGGGLHALALKLKNEGAKFGS